MKSSNPSSDSSISIAQAIRASLQTITPAWSSELLTLLSLDARYSAVVNILLNSGVQTLVSDAYITYVIIVVIIGLFIRFICRRGVNFSFLRYSSSSTIISTDLTDNVSFIERVLFAEPKYMTTQPHWRYGVYKAMYNCDSEGNYQYSNAAILVCDKTYRLVLDDKVGTTLLLWHTSTYSQTEKSKPSAYDGYRTQHIKFIKGDQATYLAWLNGKKSLIETVKDSIVIFRPMRTGNTSYKHNLPKQPFYRYRHKRLTEIINLVDTVHKSASLTHEQPKQLGILLYGPPGTGKTSLCRRIAEHLKRHIILADLVDVTSRTMLYDILYRGGDYGIANTVISLDEFDKTCEKFVKLKDLNQRREAYNMGIFTKMLERKDEEKTEKIMTSPHEYEWDFDTLLTCLSGAIVPNGRIVIATCNSIDQIKTICPELIREGRMTPIECPYGDFDDLVAMAKDYGIDIPESERPADGLTFRQSALAELLDNRPEISKRSLMDFVIKNQPLK